MKPKLFIGSSKEQLDLAYAAQEGLEFDCEATVWAQGIFDLSRTTMSSLVDALEEVDFALFVFAPDDVAMIRSDQRRQVRDNVVFELGLFAGKMGIERCFLIIPRGMDDLQIPTDLLGLTPGTFEPNREDGNLVAALGPACNRIRKGIGTLGRREKKAVSTKTILEDSGDESIISDKHDCLLLMKNWLGERKPSQNKQPIRYFEFDNALGLQKGSAKLYLEEASKRYYYNTKHKGDKLIQFERDDDVALEIRKKEGSPRS